GPIAAGLDFDKLDHDLPPGAIDKAFIRGRQIGFGDLQVEGGLLPGLVFSVHKPRCRRSVAGMQTLLFARQIIVKVISSAFLAAVESELLSHSCFFFHSDEVTTFDLDSGREQVGVTENPPGLNPAGISAGTFASHFRNSLTSNYQRVVAGGGIEPPTQGFSVLC